MMDGKTAGRAKVGVGLRVIANIHTKKAGLNLNGLFPIGFNASTDALSGDLEVKTIGLNSDQISKLITTPSELNQTSITKALEAMGAVRVLVDAETTESVPHILAVSRNGRKDRKSVVYGKSVSVRVDIGGRRINKKKKKT